MRRTTQAAYCLTLILICLFIAGCGSETDLAKVEGKVTLSGQPLEGAVVEFQPTLADGSPSSGQTDADGRYELMYTFDKEGAIPGEHIVAIRTAGTLFDDEGNEIEREERIPAKYNTHSKLKRTIEPGSNTIDLEL